MTGILTLFFLSPPREIGKQNVVEGKPRMQDTPGVQGEAERPEAPAMVRYRKDSQLLPDCSMEQSCLQLSLVRPMFDILSKEYFFMKLQQF